MHVVKISGLLGSAGLRMTGSFPQNLHQCWFLQLEPLSPDEKRNPRNRHGATMKLYQQSEVCLTLIAPSHRQQVLPDFVAASALIDSSIQLIEPKQCFFELDPLVLPRPANIAGISLGLTRHLLRIALGQIFWFSCWFGHCPMAQMACS